MEYLQKNSSSDKRTSAWLKLKKDYVTGLGDTHTVSMPPHSLYIKRLGFGTSSDLINFLQGPRLPAEHSPYVR
jgi:hypothetical protein